MFYFLTLMFSSTPMEGFGDKTPLKTRCISLYIIVKYRFVTNILYDDIILIYIQK